VLSCEAGKVPGSFNNGISGKHLKEYKHSMNKYASRYSQFALEIKSLYRSHWVTGRRIIKMRMFSPEMTQLGFILDKATQSPTGMPSVPADIIHFSKAVFHPTTALCALGSEGACLFQPDS
jgi:hypothetical protein